jgi:hypothetical protein
MTNVPLTGVHSVALAPALLVGKDRTAAKVTDHESHAFPVNRTMKVPFIDIAGFSATSDLDRFTRDEFVNPPARRQQDCGFTRKSNID